MLRIAPFPALRPPPELAHRVSAPPYDVPTEAEARAIVKENPDSFLRVTRPEVEFREGTDPTGDELHAGARRTLDRFLEDGLLAPDPDPAIYLYRLARRGVSQTGVVALAAVGDYESGVIRRHELTHRAREDDRVRHALALGCHAGPVLLAFRERPTVARLMAGDRDALPLYHFADEDGVQHTLWKVADPEAYVAAFREVEAGYIADGHHRAAGAARVAAALRREEDDEEGGAEEVIPSSRGPFGPLWEGFPVVLFPADELTILPYHRVVRELGSHTPAEVLEGAARLGTLTPSSRPRKVPPGHCALYLEGRWYTLAPALPDEDRDHPVRSLDYDLVQRKLFQGVLGTGDPRSDPRVGCVGGARGVEALEGMVDGGEAALAVAMPATSMDDVLRVADAGEILPPKSTWFDPKLRSGLFVHRFR